MDWLKEGDQRYTNKMISNKEEAQTLVNIDCLNAQSMTTLTYEL